jgi:hypothetical protein
MVEGLDPRRFGGCSGCGDGATAKPCFGLRGNGTARGRVAQRRSPTGISQESWRWGLRRGEADDGDGDGRRGPRGAATLPSSNDVPWMSPSITKCKQLQKPDFQHSVRKYKTDSSSLSEVSEILKSLNTYNSCAVESPGPIHAHTFRCTSKKSCKHTASHKIIKNPQTPQKLHSST